MFWKKMTISLVLILTFILAVDIAKADFVFGTATNLGPTVNSTAGEYYPKISADGLSLEFGSDRTDGYGNRDIWVTTRTTIDENWSTPVNLGPTVNTSANDPIRCISFDGLELFFSSNQSGGQGGPDIWVRTCATTSDSWGPAVNLGPNVNSSAIEGGPNISADGLSLYFNEANRAGGFGGFEEIWVTTRVTKDDPWDTAVNLGPAINSAHATSASISSDGLALFIQSNRPGGLGSADLWVSIRSNISDPWPAPFNLGSTVNSSSGEFQPSISPDGKILYFNSDRPDGFGSWDLWQVSIDPVVDLNGDGIVDSADMCIIVDNWGTDNRLCDVGPMPWGDDIVDVQDLIVLAEHLFEEFPPAVPGTPNGEPIE